MTPEIHQNYLRFEQRWQSELNSTTNTLSDREAYAKTYSRLISLHAWREELLSEKISPEAIQFALEGQNDFLVSYMLARGGQWRSALQALRASIENYLNCLYYMDHPIELKLWADGKRRNKFSDLMDYFKAHPDIAHLEDKETGIKLLKSEYATLSRAVHASAISFRMTSDNNTRLFTDNVASLGMWEHRTKNVCRGINLLLLSLFREHLTATRKRNLRKAIAFSLHPADKNWIKRRHSITITFQR